MLNPPQSSRAPAAAYADLLRADLGLSVPAVSLPADAHPAQAWARSGLMALTGHEQGPPQLCPLPLPSCADAALAVLAALADRPALSRLSGAQLLGERAAIAGHGRRGSCSPGGACRLLQAADGWIALNLARNDDWDLLPAWLEVDLAPDWDALRAIVATQPVTLLLERGHELGLAIAAAAAAAPVATRPWFQVTAGTALPSAAKTPARRRPRVLDLSSLWAGPLCSHLLLQAGAEVIKLESTRRPDGARSGPAAFFDLLNCGKRCVALDFTTAQGREQLRQLIASVDIVIEASRPRALRQLGIDAEALVAAQPGLTWISLTGYGRDEPQAQWIAYGDDAAVAAGLSQAMFEATGQWLIVGDAIADPLTGLHAALAAWASWQAGGSRLISLALRDVVAHCIAFGRSADTQDLAARYRDWCAALQPEALRMPQARAAAGVAAALGADTAAVLAECSRRC